MSWRRKRRGIDLERLKQNIMDAYISTEIKYIEKNIFRYNDNLFKEIGIYIENIQSNYIITFLNGQTQWSLSIFDDIEFSEIEFLLCTKLYQTELEKIIEPLIASLSHIICSRISLEYCVICNINYNGINDKTGYINIAYMPSKESLEQAILVDKSENVSIFCEAKPITIPVVLGEEHILERLDFLQTHQNNWEQANRLVFATLHIPNFKKKLTIAEIVSRLNSVDLIWQISSQHLFAQGFFAGVTYELWEETCSEFTILFSSFEKENFIEHIETIAISIAHLFADALLMERNRYTKLEDAFNNSYDSVVREIQTGQETIYEANKINPLFSDDHKVYYGKITERLRKSP
jgi:hypothetical protein